MINKATLKQDIEYLLFIEHEEDMKNYTHLQPYIDKIVDIAVRHAKQSESDLIRNFRIDTLGQVNTKLSEFLSDVRIEETDTPPLPEDVCGFSKPKDKYDW